MTAATLLRQSARVMAKGASGRARWKKVELAFAVRLGGRRIPVTGRERGWAPDVAHRWLAIEIKSRKRALSVIAEMMDQAVKAAAWYLRRDPSNPRLPIGIYHVSGTHLDNALVFMRLRDFEAWFGSTVIEAAREVSEEV